MTHGRFRLPIERLQPAPGPGMNRGGTLAGRERSGDLGFAGTRRDLPFDRRTGEAREGGVALALGLGVDPARCALGHSESLGDVRSCG